MMLVGSTGTRVHPMKTVHALQSEQVALGNDDPTRWSRPFDKSRKGMVLGEGAAVLVLEELRAAEARGARIYGEVVGHAARNASDSRGVGLKRRALGLAMRGALATAGLPAEKLSHVHAHGVSTVVGDRDEAGAMHDALGPAARSIPTVAAKSHFGNLGGAAGWSNAWRACSRYGMVNSSPCSTTRRPTPNAPSVPPAGEIRPATCSSPPP